MQYKFLNIFLDPRELLTKAKSEINPFLLENNATKIEAIYEFYKSNVSLLYVNGFLGTGKAKIVGYSLSFLASDTIVLKYNCFNSTVLDDILLSFFNEFKKLSAQQIISEPKVKSENFTQKINSYFAQVEKPFVIILDSFEAILDENRQEILDFIFHLNSLQKIKTIIIGRTFDSKHFEKIPVERISILALERNAFEKYLKSEKVKVSGAIIDEFYKVARGYYFFTALTLKLMKHENLSLVDFLTNFRTSYLPFFDYLGKRSLELIPPTERNLFWFLSVIRHPISIDLLKKLNFYDEEKINFLIENFILIKDNSLIYVQDYIKDFADSAIAPNIAQKIRQYIIDLYSTQLPLKPLERDICISRQTMRKEIEFHQRFLPKKHKSFENRTIDIDYLSYSQTTDFSEKEKPEVQTAENAKKPESKIDLTQRKNISINTQNLPYQQNNLPIESLETQKEKALSMTEIVQELKQAEFRFNYSKVIELCQKAFLLKDEPQYKELLPTLYIKTAFAYQKLADCENALNYYKLAQDLYANSNNLQKVNQIKYSIAKIYYETFKTEMARELFTQIANSPESSRALCVKSYLQLANIEESATNIQKAFEYYKLAIEIADDSVEPEILSEIYFKYALALDDKNDVRGAIEFYTKCINLSDDINVNKFLSSAYSNMATLHLEKNDTEKAVEHFEKAYQFDEKSGNIEGMYYSANKLASMLSRRMPEKALKYFETALDCAKLIKDSFYIVSAYLAIGDFHYDKNKNETALKYYIYALDLAKTNFSQDNINKINTRINDIKFKLGIEKFESLVTIIEANKNE